MTGTEFLLGGWFVSPVIRSVVKNAQNYLNANYELQHGTHDLVDNLSRTLLLCQATVEEVEKRAVINNPALGNWLKRFKLVVYDAEDVLDNIEAKSIKEKVQGKNKVSKFASSSLSGIKNMFMPDEGHKSLKKVVDQLNQLSADIPKILNLVNLNEKNETYDHKVTDQRETISQPLGEVGLYGRQDKLDLILEIISGSNLNPSKKQVKYFNTYSGLFVIPIAGIGGVGKTALAQAVYNNPAVQQDFELKTWISVSCNLDVVLLMRKIIQSFGGYLRLDVNRLEEVSNNLDWVIKGRRFLVILDDMSEKIEYKWDVIYTILSHRAPGSVVLITTQNKKFANRVATFSYIALSPLEPRSFWKLFKHFAFGNLVMPYEKRKILKQIGKQIAEKLHGLPLAAKVIGNILRSDVDEEGWRRISKSEWWDLPESKSQILPSIGLNYEHLEPYLRQCFAYCSVFPRNSLLEKDRLVQMWIAQEFVHHDNGERLEDLGRKWFDKLVEMSFFQPIGDNTGFIMPNLMHDLAIIVSSYECFYLSDESVEIPEGVRHLAIDTKHLGMVKGVQKCKHLRSFFYFGLSHIDGMYSTINESLHYLDRIRVLDLSYLHMETKEPPPAIRNLTHLRFLDLSSTGIETLTRSSINHYHLQALHLRNCQFLDLPSDINKLINLRHLSFDIGKVARISCIGQLTSLQELNEYVVGENEGHRITELKNMREITGYLKISQCHNVRSKDEAMQANLQDKRYVDNLNICFFSTKRKSNIDFEILDGLKPHKEIRKLRIGSYMGRSFPDWLMQMSHFIYLQHADFSNFTSIEVLPPIGQLPNLKHVYFQRLNSIKKIDHNIYGNEQTVFPSLREFIMNDLSSCEEWTDAQVEDFFPHLCFLEIRGCEAFKRLPLYRFSVSLKILHIFFTAASISVNINNLRSLEDLDLNGCSELTIQGEMQALTNLKCLTILNCPKLHSSSRFYTTSKHKGKGLQVQLQENLQSLTYINMDQSILHYDYPQILGRLPSIRILNCKGYQFIQFTSYEIQWFEQVTTLRELYFTQCEFEHLPSSLATLSSLIKLVLESCNKLESLPANGMPPFLRELTLLRCSQQLVQRCQPDEGEDWPLISHVILIRVNREIIYRHQRSEGTSG